MWNGKRGPMSSKFEKAAGAVVGVAVIAVVVVAAFVACVALLRLVF
jgi:hypothetical protein